MSRSSAASKRSSAGSSALLWFEARAVPAMRRLGDLPFIAAVRDALPWSFIGLAAAFIPIAVVHPGPAGQSLGLRLAAALLPAFGVMAATLAVLLPLRLARSTGYPPLPLVAGTLAGFAFALPRPYGPTAIAYLRTLGASGLFLAMLACGVTAGATALLRRKCSLAVSAWAAATLCAAVFMALSFSPVTPSGAIAASMQPISRLGDTYAALICIVLAQTLLWTAGVHGPAVLATIVTPIYLTMQMQNAHAFAVHAPLPYAVVTSTFLFVFPGGSGATLPMAALFALSRVVRLRRLGRATLLPAIFNLNEPLIFGAPIVFNPYLVVPFVAVPFVLATLTYAATAAGLVHRAAFYVPSSVPTFVSTYLATQDVRALALVAVNIALATAMYYPFVRAYERHLTAPQ